MCFCLLLQCGTVSTILDGSVCWLDSIKHEDNRKINFLLNERSKSNFFDKIVSEEVLNLATFLQRFGTATAQECLRIGTGCSSPKDDVLSPQFVHYYI